MSKLTKLLMLPLVLGLLVWLSACNSDGTAAGALTGNKKVSIASSIPENSSMVFHINIGQLMEKADYATIKQTSFFKDMVEKAKKDNPAVIPFLEDPAATGLNMNGDIAMSISVANIEDTDDYRAIIMPIADKEKVMAALATASKDQETKPTTEEREGYSITTFGKKKFVVMNDKIMALVNKDDEVATNNILNPTGQGVKTNASFAKHYNEGKDAMFWMGTSEIVNKALKTNPKAKMGLGMAQITVQDLENNYMAFYYDFKKGEIDAGGHFDFNEGLKGKLSGIFANNVSSNYAKHLPADNMAAAATFGLSVDGILTFLGNIGLDAMANPMVQKSTGMSLEQIQSMLVGDMAAAVYGGETPAALFAIGIKDEAAVSTMISKIGLVKAGDTWKLSNQGMDYTLQIVDGLLLVATDKNVLELAVKGGANQIVSDLSGGWMGAYIDYEMVDKNKDAFAKVLDINLADFSSESTKEFSSIILKFNGGDTESKIYLKNKDENAAKKAIEMVDKAYQERMSRQDEFDDFDEEFGNEGDDTKAL